MRVVKYQLEGSTRWGVRRPDGVVDAGFTDLRDWLEAGAPSVDSAISDGEVVRPDKELAPVAHRAQVIFTGGNYADHLAETSLAPKEPVYYPGLWSSIIGPGADIRIPEERTDTDYEVELAVVMSKTAYKIKADQVWDYVFGFTVVNDVSARDVMKREFLQVMLCKCPDTFCPVGPEIVTIDEVGDIGGRAVTSRVNGVLKQNSNTDNMIYKIPELLEFLTRTVTLSPGDVLTTGTPGGVGAFRNPPEFLQPGDTVTVAVDGVGELTNPIVAGW